LKRGSACFVEKFVYPPDKLIELIHKVGGIAIFAHPGHAGLDNSIPELAAMGLDGLEAYHSDHSPEVRNHYVRLAEKYNMIVTGGSDCHGRTSTHGLRIGKNEVPDSVIESMQKRRAMRLAETESVFNKPV
jgi:predicted metal-dependent phosphoesterase TrpH